MSCWWPAATLARENTPTDTQNDSSELVQGQHFHNPEGGGEPTSSLEHTAVHLQTDTHTQTRRTGPHTHAHAHCTQTRHTHATMVEVARPSGLSGCCCRFVCCAEHQIQVPHLPGVLSFRHCNPGSQEALGSKHCRDRVGVAVMRSATTTAIYMRLGTSAGAMDGSRKRAGVLSRWDWVLSRTCCTKPSVCAPSTPPCRTQPACGMALVG